MSQEKVKHYQQFMNYMWQYQINSGMVCQWCPSYVSCHQRSFNYQADLLLLLLLLILRPHIKLIRFRGDSDVHIMVHWHTADGKYYTQYYTKKALLDHTKVLPRAVNN